MMRFVETAIAKAGLLPVLAAHRSGDLEALRTTVTSWGAADLLVLGAVADAVRSEDVGQVVHVHEADGAGADVTWIVRDRASSTTGSSELDFLRAVAIARIAARKGARIGVDWSERGMELAQVALGFGATDLRGPITRKSGLPIYEDERLKVKGQGMVALAAIKRQEIAALVRHAGRLPVFAADEAHGDGDALRGARESTGEVAGV